MTLSKPMPVRFYLIRHGETEWSLSGQYTGRTNILLLQKANLQKDAKARPTTTRSSFNPYFDQRRFPCLTS